MATPTSYTNKSVLILDDMPEMRSSLRSQVGSLGFENITLSSNVKEALDRFATNNFDIILCDYYLAGGTDGQQFLEYLRNRKIIGRGALFVMITAEQGYDHVVTAAECLPDDYLLKPFTAELLKVRLERLLDKKQRLARVDQLQNRNNWNGVITECDEIINAKDRYLVDVMRIKGNALLFSGRTQEAVEFYQQMNATRPMPWAKLGLARAFQKNGDLAASQNTLSDLIQESPRLMAAYDLLSQIHLATGDADAAMAILDSARTISPNSLARHRAIANVAEGKGDFARVEQALDPVIKKTRNSPLRETDDFARLGNALTEIGQLEKAIALMEDARETFKNDAHDPLLAAVEAIAQHKAGNFAKAENALARALQSDVGKLSTKVSMRIAQACLTTGQHENAQNILKRIVQSNPESKSLHAQVSKVLRDNGAAELADKLVADSIREIIQLNNEAVHRAKAGEYNVAAQMLTDAAHRLPGNMQIVANASAAILLDVLNNGVDSDKLRKAQGFQQTVLAEMPTHPKLGEITELINRIRAKYTPSKP